MDGVSVLAQKIRSAVNRPVTIEKQPFELACSIGIAIYPDHGLTGDELVRNADHAMYTAKRNRLGVRLFSTDTPADTVKKVAPLRLVGKR